MAWIFCPHIQYCLIPSDWVRDVWCLPRSCCLSCGWASWFEEWSRGLKLERSGKPSVIWYIVQVIVYLMGESSLFFTTRLNAAFYLKPTKSCLIRYFIPWIPWQITCQSWRPSQIKSWQYLLFYPSFKLILKGNGRKRKFYTQYTNSSPWAFNSLAPTQL